jgi:hypothetical protein
MTVLVGAVGSGFPASRKKERPPLSPRRLRVGEVSGHSATIVEEPTAFKQSIHGKNIEISEN